MNLQHKLARIDRDIAVWLPVTIQIGVVDEHDPAGDVASDVASRNNSERIVAGAKGHRRAALDRLRSCQVNRRNQIISRTRHPAGLKGSLKTWNANAEDDRDNKYRDYQFQQREPI